MSETMEETVAMNRAWVKVQLLHRLADVHEEEQGWSFDRISQMQTHLTGDVIEHVTMAIGQVIIEATDYGMDLGEVVGAICGVNNEMNNEEGERQ